VAETNKTMVMKFGKLYDSETNKYQGKALRAGQPLFSRLEQKDGMYQKPSIYGFETTEGDTAYYTGTSKSRSMSMLDAKGTSRFLSNVLQNFDETHMDKSGFKKLDLPKDMNVDEYYEKFFKKGKTPRKAGDKPKMGSKVFNFLKKAR
jgi:hypothetical protein|tara:strand:- start:444 stop:887 length:444 start_codon:yes stop_codon:yes gene_type:complete